MPVKSKAVGLATLGLAIAARMALADVVDLRVPVDVAARRLQAALPSCAPDRVVEVRRKRRTGGWDLAFWLEGFSKTQVTEVRIDLVPRGAPNSRASVEVVSIRGGLLFDSERELPAEARRWAEAVGRIVVDSQGRPWCE
jgi:hypothetical protein